MAGVARRVAGRDRLPDVFGIGSNVGQADRATRRRVGLPRPESRKHTGAPARNHRRGARRCRHSVADVAGESLVHQVFLADVGRVTLAALTVGLGQPALMQDVVIGETMARLTREVACSDRSDHLRVGALVAQGARIGMLARDVRVVTLGAAGDQAGRVQVGVCGGVARGAPGVGGRYRGANRRVGARVARPALILEVRPLRVLTVESNQRVVMTCGAHRRRGGRGMRRRAGAGRTRGADVAQSAADGRRQSHCPIEPEFCRLPLAGDRGEMLAVPKPFSGTSGTLKPNMPAKNFLDLLMFEGLEHHISLVYGNHINSLRAFARLADIPILIMNEEVDENKIKS